MFEQTDMVCEKHPLTEWPHDGCLGPGMPIGAGIDWVRGVLANSANGGYAFWQIMKRGVAIPRRPWCCYIDQITREGCTSAAEWNISWPFMDEALAPGGVRDPYAADTQACSDHFGHLIPDGVHSLEIERVKTTQEAR
jgi:hypothetical protein